MSIMESNVEIHRNKVRLDWAMGHSALKQMQRQEIANACFHRATEKFVQMRGLDKLIQVKTEQSLGITTSDYAYIADFARRLIYKHANDLSWVVPTLGQAPLSTLDLTVEFNNQAELSGPLSEVDQGDRTVVNWTKYDIELEKYVGRFLVTDAARARGRSNIQALTTMKSLGEQLTKKKEREAITELYGNAFSANETAATAAWNTSSADIETDINAAIGKVLNNANNISPKGIRIIVLMPALVWMDMTAQQSTLNLSVLDHFKKTLKKFEIIPTKFWHTDETDADAGIQDDALVYIPGGGTALHGWSANVPFPLVERQRLPTAGWEYFFQQWFRTVATPESKDDTTCAQIAKITGVE